MKVKIGLILVAALATSAAFPAAAVEAQWKAHQFKFRYGGFTTRYTCQGIEGKIKLILRHLGARDDVRAKSSCAGGFSEVQPFNTVTLGFAVPVEAEGATPGETFPAEWREITLGRNEPRGLDPGECELVEQLVQQVGPLLNVRNLDDRSTCVPHQLNVGDPNVKLAVLVPVDPEKANEAAAPAP